MKVRRIHNWILLADLVWVVAALAWAEALRYGLHWDQATGLSVRNSLPFLVATWIIWTVLSRAMQLDGFRGGWRFPAVVAHLCFGVLFVMAILLAGAFLTRHYVVPRVACASLGCVALAQAPLSTGEHQSGRDRRLWTCSQGTCS